MASKYPYTKKCIHCSADFVIKSAHYNTKKYCTFECSVESKTVHTKEKECLQCGKLLSGCQKKYCSQSCSATANNTGRRRHGNPPNNCLKCGQLTSSSSQIYCSPKCFGIAHTFRTDEERRAFNAQAQSRYRAKGYRKIHPDADPEKIKQIYLNCPPGYEVDHKVPVSRGGWHHEDNLQYLPISENRRKGNRYIG